MRTTWLLFGTILGTIGGCIASQPEGYDHGTEERGSVSPMCNRPPPGLLWLFGEPSFYQILLLTGHFEDASERPDFAARL